MTRTSFIEQCSEDNRMITLQERVHSAPIPDGWQLDKLQHTLKARSGNKNTGMQNDNLLSLSYGRIIKKNITTEDGLLPESFETYQIVEPGDIVLRLTDLQNDKRSLRQGLVKEQGIITSAYDAVHVMRDNDPHFWFYALLALDLAKYYYSLGGGVRQSVKFSDFPNEWVYRPDLPTQKRIAAFLDRETERIDALIAKKERLVEVLKEKSHVLAEDLLGSVADDHKIRLRFALWNIEQGWSPQCEDRTVDGDGWGVLKLGAITGGAFFESEHKALPSDLQPITAYRVKPQDVLVARASGSPNLVGKACHVDEISKNLMISDKHFRLIPNPRFIRTKYLAMIINSRNSRSQIENSLSSAEGMARNIGQGVLYNLRCPIPDLSRQDEILHITQKMDIKVGILREKTLLSIDRLHEYRAALITAAVTGQIDVGSYGKSGASSATLDRIEEEMQE